MSSGRHDAHLIACRLGKKSGVNLLRAYRESGGEGPVILIADDPGLAARASAWAPAATTVKLRPRPIQPHLHSD
jgi:hypothetical protein